MPWLPINNGDAGNFESDPGSDVYNSNGWDLEEKLGTNLGATILPFTVERTNDFAYKNTYAARARATASGEIKLDQPVIGGFRFTAVGLKHYAIRAYITYNLPFNQNIPLNQMFLRLTEDANSPANGLLIDNQLRYLNFINEGNFLSVRQYARAANDGAFQFSLTLNRGNVPGNDMEGLQIFADQIEYFEHDVLTSSIAITPMSYRNANDAVATVTRAGGSGSFTLLIERKEAGSFVFYNQKTVLEEDEILDLVTNNMEPGDYRYTLTDNELEYETTEEFTVANPASTLDLTVSKTDVTAAGLTDGTISLSATGDSGNYTFDISPKNGTEVSSSERTNLPPGVYSCSVTDTGSGETVTEDVVVNDPDSNLSLSLTKQDVSIPGLSNGQITANAFGDTGVYAFSISPQTGQQDNNIFTGLSAGVYTVTVEDLNSEATESEQITIEEPDELAISVTKTNNLCFESENGTANLTVSGGTAPYTYLWNDGFTTKDRTGLSTGNHQVRITDSLGYSKVFTIAISSPPRIVINITKTGQEVNVSVTGGVPPYSYLWSDGSTATNRTLAVGNYVLQVTDDNNCTKSTTVEITDFKFYFSKNPVWLERTTDPSAKENLSWDAVIKIEKDYNSGTFTELFSANHPAKEDGSTIFEFSEILKGQLQLALPEHKGKDPYVMEGNFKRFFVESNEKYGAPPVAQTAVTTETFHILRGGLSLEEFASGEFFSVFLDNPKTPFFSWEAIAKNVYPDQPEYLAYPLVNIGISQLKIKAEAFDVDNTLLFTKQTDFINGVQPYMLINFPVGFSQLGFSNIAGNESITYYTVEALNQNDQVISEKKYYYLNWKTQNRRKYFIYENALGVWATLVAEGSEVGNLEVEMEMIKKPVQFAYEASERREKAENKILKQSFTHSAGNIIEEEAFILADFIRSENVYEFTEKRWRAVSIEMGGDWFNNFEDSTPFEFAVMYEQDKNWTPDVFRLDNRRIVAQESAEESTLFPTINTTKFEETYAEWDMPESLRDIDRYILFPASPYGPAVARFLTSNYENYRAAGEINETFAGIKTLFFFGIKNLLREGKRNFFKIHIKSDGIDFGTDSNPFNTLLPYLRLKLKGEPNYQFNLENAGPINGLTRYKIDIDLNGFTTDWVQVGFYIDVLSFNTIRLKNDSQDYILEDAIFEIIWGGLNNNINYINDVPIYFDNFSVTYENL